MKELRQSGVVLLHLCIPFLILVTAFVSLRFCAKWTTKTGLRAEDWLILAATLTFYAETGMILQSIFTGGDSIFFGDLTFSEINHVLFNMYIFELLAGLCITLIKLSILYFFETLFPVRMFRFFTLTLKIICILWWIIYTILAALQCNPVQNAWNLLEIFDSQTCTPYGKLALGFTITNMLVDIAVICLPLYIIPKLQLPPKKKIFIVGILVLGGFTIITSAVRMTYLWNIEGIALNPEQLLDAVAWNIVHLATGIFCACLPTYGPLLSKATFISTGVKSMYSSVSKNFRPFRSSRTVNSSISPLSKTTRSMPTTPRPQAWDDKPLPPMPAAEPPVSWTSYVEEVASSHEDEDDEDDEATTRTSTRTSKADSIDNTRRNREGVISWYLDPEQAMLAVRESYTRGRGTIKDVV